MPTWTSDRQKNISTGEFWVDPNEGITEDAIKVYCDFSFNATCLYSSKEKKVFTNVIDAMEMSCLGKRSHGKIETRVIWASFPASPSFPIPCVLKRVREGGTQQKFKEQFYEMKAHFPHLVIFSLYFVFAAICIQKEEVVFRTRRL